MAKVKRAPLTDVLQSVSAAANEPTTTTKPGREGKTNITGYFDPAWKNSLRLIQIATGQNFQASLEEALADLFRKHNVPVPNE